MIIRTPDPGAQPTAQEDLLTAPTLHPTKTSHHRFHFLDALRGIASILVAFLHIPRYMHFRPVHNSFLAVDFFFCLSGFVIAFSYEKRLQNALSLKNFLVARAIRLYPTYILGILAGSVAFFAFDFHLQMTHMVIARLAALISLQLVMLPPLVLWYNHSLFPLDFPAWSMFFEILANLAYAWMVPRHFARTVPLVTLVLMSLIVMVCWLLHGGTIDVGQLSNPVSLLGVFRVASAFLTGVLLFRLFRWQGAPHWNSRKSGVIALAVSLTMIFLLLGPLVAMQTRLFSMISVAAVFPYLVYLGARCRLPSVWHRPCTFLGDTSYPLYLLHVPFLKLLSLSWVMKAVRAHPESQSAFFCGTLLIAILASVLATKYYDVPVRRFLTRRYNAHQSNRSFAVQA